MRSWKSSDAERRGKENTMDIENLTQMNVQAARQAMAGNRSRGLDQLAQKAGQGRMDEAELREACDGFEAMFIAKLWEQMRTSVSGEDSLHNKQEEKYMAMFDQGFAEHVVSGGGIGLGRMLFESLKERLTEASTSTHPEKTPTSGETGADSMRTTAKSTPGSSPEVLLRADELADRIVRQKEIQG
jgi:Rod binding domain-containing protein